MNIRYFLVLVFLLFGNLSKAYAFQFIYSYKAVNIDLQKISSVKNLVNEINNNTELLQNNINNKLELEKQFQQSSIESIKTINEISLHRIQASAIEEDLELIYILEEKTLEYTNLIQTRLDSLNNELIAKKENQSELLAQLEFYQIEFDKIIRTNFTQGGIINNCSSPECFSKIKQDHQQYLSQKKIIEGQISSISNLIGNNESNIKLITNEIEKNKEQIIVFNIRVREFKDELREIEKNNLSSEIIMSRLNSKKHSIQVLNTALLDNISFLQNKIDNISTLLNANYTALDSLINTYRGKFEKIAKKYTDLAQFKAMESSTEDADKLVNNIANIEAKNRAIRDHIYNLKNTEQVIVSNNFTAQNTNIEIPNIETDDLSQIELTLAQDVFDSEYIKVYLSNLNSIFGQKYEKSYFEAYELALNQIGELILEYKIDFAHAFNIKQPKNENIEKLILINDSSLLQNILKNIEQINLSQELNILSQRPLSQEKLLELIADNLDLSNIKLNLKVSPNLDIGLMINK